MPKKARSILIIPPRGGRIRFLRVRVRVIVLLFLFFLAGFAGLFLPFSGLTLDVVEQNQKKNLAEQNQKLLQRIHGMRKMLHGVDVKLDELHVRKEGVEALAGIHTPEDSGGKHEQIGPLGPAALDKLLEYVSASEELYNRFAKSVQTRPSLLHGLPVLPPVAGESVITAGFGEMRDPFTGATKWHYGVDYAAQRDTPVNATADGAVVDVEKHRRWGWRVRIRHTHGFVSVYAHLGAVKTGRGRRIKRGDAIGTVGMSGLATGPHLHYELWLNGKAVNPLDYIFPSVEIAEVLHEDNES